jgi:hypothetical protein
LRARRRSINSEDHQGNAQQPADDREQGQPLLCRVKDEANIYYGFSAPRASATLWRPSPRHRCRVPQARALLKPAQARTIVSR